MSKTPQVKSFQGLPVVTADKMKYLDNIATLEYGIKEDILMENAGKSAAQNISSFCSEKINKNISEIKVGIYCGRGNNGGDGLVAARYLAGMGYKVRLYAVAPSDKGYGKLFALNLEKLSGLVNVKLSDFSNIKEIEEESLSYDVLIDALLGVSSVGKPAGVVRRLIQIMNKSQKPIIALDIPSGLSPDTGHHSGVFVTANMTLTMGFAKSGLMAAHAQKNTGEIKVLDIGYPPELIKKAES